MNDEDLDRRLGKVPELEADSPCIDDGELMAYRLEQLPLDRSAVVDKHLTHCKACRGLLLELARPVSERIRQGAEAAFQKPKVVPINRLAFGGALALAAGLAAVALLPSEPMLADYELEGPLGGIAIERGEPGKGDVFAPDGVVRFHLRPKTTGTPDVRLSVLRVDGGRLVDVTGDDWSVSQEGAVRWSAPVQAVFGDGSGRRQLVLVLSDRRSPKGWVGRELETAKQVDPNAKWWTIELEVLVPTKEGDQP